MRWVLLGRHLRRVEVQSVAGAARGGDVGGVLAKAAELQQGHGHGHQVLVQHLGEVHDGPHAQPLKVHLEERQPVVLQPLRVARTPPPQL